MATKVFKPDTHQINDLCRNFWHPVICVSAITNQKRGLACCQFVQQHLALSFSSPTSTTSSGLSRCLACSQSPNQIHFICNQLELPGTGGRDQSSDQRIISRPRLASRPWHGQVGEADRGGGLWGGGGGMGGFVWLVWASKHRAPVGMKGEKMKIWRLTEPPRGDTWKSRVRVEAAAREAEMLHCELSGEFSFFVFFFWRFHQVEIGCLKPNGLLSTALNWGN